MTKEESHFADQIAKLHKKLEEERRHAQHANWLFAAVLLVILSGFFGLMQHSLKKTYNENAIKTAAEKMISQISPMIPHYFASMTEGLPEMLQDEISEKVIKKLPEMGKKLEFHSAEIEKQLSEYTAQQIAQHILADPKIKAAMESQGVSVDNAQAIHDVIVAESTKLADRISLKILGLYQKDMDELTELVATFPRDTRSTVDNATAVRMLMHYLLQLADQEVMNQPGDVAQF